MIAGGRQASGNSAYIAKSSRAAWCIAGAAGTVLLLLPAMWNGFPFVYYDSRSFILMAFEPAFHYIRSIYYSGFIRATSFGFSLWPSVLAQAAITVYVLCLTVRCVAPAMSPTRFVLVVLGLTIGTGLPWVVGQIMPDYLTGLVVLSTYLIAMHGKQLGTAHCVALACITTFGAVAHPSLMLFAAGLAMLLLAARLSWKWIDRISRDDPPRWSAPAFIVVLAAGLIVGSNYALTGEVFFSRGGASILLGRIVQNGLAYRLLDETCPASNYRLCAYKDRLPPTAPEFLFDKSSPFVQLGGFAGMASESSAMVTDSLKRYPFLHIRKAARATYDQLRKFATGDGIFMFNTPTSLFGFSTRERAADQIVLIAPVLEARLPHLAADYRDARQQTEQIPLTQIGNLHGPVIILSLVGVLVAMVGAFRRRGRAFYLPVFVLVALLGNAFICGAIAGPLHRYQARVAWLLPFTAVLAIAGRAGEPGVRRHGAATLVPDGGKSSDFRRVVTVARRLVGGSG